MPYNFDEIITRRGTNCVKWDAAPPCPSGDSPVVGDLQSPTHHPPTDIIPLWVADMDFRTYPAITEALRRRVEHGVFGYTHVPDSYKQRVIDWFVGQHHIQPYHPDEVIMTTGVVPALSAIVRGLTLPGDKVLLLSPVYNCFFSSIRNQGCIVEDCPLHYEVVTLTDKTSVGEPVEQKEGRYTIDWEAFERQCADPKVRLFLFCNPHNPAGRVWTRDEVQRIHDICLRNEVFVVADEIHCEFTRPGTEYCSYASLGEEARRNCALCVAASKAFNIAGLQTAHILVADPHRRERIDRAINLHEVCDVNPFGIIATQEAYTEGGAEWLRQLNEYIWDNYQLLLHTFREQLPQFPVVKLEGTYLAWVDCEVLGRSSVEIAQVLCSQYGVWVNDGEMYGAMQRPFVRVNLACPRAILAEGLQRMVAGMKDLCREKK